jgi:hypothetical protein
MGALILVGFGAFFVTSLAIGLRLLWLWRRTRQLPELMIAIGILCVGPVGFSLSVVGQATSDTAPMLSRAALATALFSIAVGTVAQYTFNWRVFHPENRRLRGLLWLAALSFAGCFAYEAVAWGFASHHETDVAFFARYLTQVGCLFWGAAEALRYWSMMRRRARLGLADFIVVNRFLLWAIGIGAAGAGTLIGAVVQMATGVPGIQFPPVLAVSSALGFTAAVALGLAFLPPPAYTRFILSRAARAAKA